MLALIRKLLMALLVVSLAACGSSGGGGGSSSPAAPSDSVELSSGSLDQPFDPAVTSYTGSVANDVTTFSMTPSVVEAGASVTINGNAVSPGTPSPDIPLSVGDNLITMVITEADGVTERTYSFTITREPAATDLTALSISSGILSPSFAIETTSYSATVPTDVASIDVIATLADATSSLTINSVSAISGIASSVNLNLGLNTINIVVTAADGLTSNTYTVEVTRTVPGTDATLSGLVMSPNLINEAFNAYTTSYTATVEQATTSVTITPTATDANYSGITVNGSAVVSGQVSNAINVAEGDNAITIIVTAEDGVSTNTYTVNVHRKSSDATLSGLVMSPNLINETFASGTTSYTAMVEQTDTTVTFTATANNSNYSSITVDGVSAISAQASSAVSLAEGANSVDVVVTAEDGSTIQTYTIDIYRKKSDSKLLDIQLSSGALGAAFQSTQLTYTAATPYLENSIQVTATLSDSTYASMTIEGQAVANNTASQAIALTIGVPLDINIVVTAHDGSTSEYIVTATRDSAAAFAADTYIKASNTEAGDAFGFSVAISGDTMAIGAQLEDSAASGIFHSYDASQVDDCEGASTNCALDSGAVFVFKRTNGVWAQQAFIKAPDVDANDLFGTAVALDGDTLAVSAMKEDSGVTGAVNAVDFPPAWDLTGKAESGAVYVYKRTNDVWAQEAFIKASNTGAGDNFGFGLALNGDWLAVGAAFEDSGSATNQTDESAASAGAAYTYKRTGSSWAFDEYLKSSNLGAPASYQFGSAIAIDGNTMVIGAPGEDGTAEGIYTTQAAIDAVDVNDLTNDQDSGSIYIFTHDGSSWGLGTYVKANTSGSKNKNDLFGSDVDIFGDTIIVGAPGESSPSTDPTLNSAYAAGAAYIFTRSGSVWSQQAYMKANTIGAGDRFGVQVSLGDGYAVIGASGEDSAATGIDGNDISDCAGAALNCAADSGAAYLFTGAGATWTQQKYIKANNTGAGDELGGPVAIYQNRSNRIASDNGVVVISAAKEDGSDTGVGATSDDLAADAGAIYLFE